MEGDTITPARPDGGLVTFQVAGQTYGLPLAHVERVLRMVAVSPVPEAAPYVMGAIDLHGHVVPVVDMRARLGHPARPPAVDDRLLVVHSEGARFAIVVDEALDVLTPLPEDLQAPRATMKDKPLLQAILGSDEQMVFVLDPSHLAPAV